MNTFKYNEYKVNVCTDIYEWVKKFYDAPEGAVLDNPEQASKDIMGFADVNDSEIWIFLPKPFDTWELELTIAHEIGHVIKPDPNPTSEDPDELHEERANHYENFYKTVNDILFKILNHDYDSNKEDVTYKKHE
jgi:hypothetical protein